ncbi:MAG: flagellar motor protein MotB [Ignavibacteria bacterium]|nr:flagellar motor protein MotB [Ignavibacteria bacterium]
MKKRNKSNLPKDNSERYLLTYADLITLLLGLFIILYASAQVDEGKYQEFAKAFSDYFASAGAVEKGSGVMEGFKSGIPEPIFEHTSPERSIEEIYSDAESALKSFISKGVLSLRIHDSELVFSLSERLLFEPAKAGIQREGGVLLDSLTKIFNNLDYQVTVDGHTDSNPIRTFRYESNWHLSVARALNVGYRLVQRGLQENKLIIRGFGAERPIVENNSAEGRALNRRVEITLSKISISSPAISGYNNF